MLGFVAWAFSWFSGLMCFDAWNLLIVLFYYSLCYLCWILIELFVILGLCWIDCRLLVSFLRCGFVSYCG